MLDEHHGETLCRQLARGDRAKASVSASDCPDAGSSSRSTVVGRPAHGRARRGGPGRSAADRRGRRPPRRARPARGARRRRDPDRPSGHGDGCEMSAATRTLLVHGQEREQLEALEGAGQADASPLVRRTTGDVCARDADLSGRRAEQTADDVEQRGLPGAVRTDQPGDGRRFGVQVDIRRARGCRRSERSRPAPASAAVTEEPRRGGARPLACTVDRRPTTRSRLLGPVGFEPLRDSRGGEDGHAPREWRTASSRSAPSAGRRTAR